MSIRKNRRAVLAELLLTGNPSGVYIREDQTSMAIDFETIADLRSWLDTAGLTSPDLLTSEHEGTDRDGQPYRSMHAYPTWHGWEIYAQARESTDPAPPLDRQTTDRLTALAGAGLASGDNP